MVATWKVSNSGRAAQFTDGDLDLVVLAFQSGGDLFAEVSLRSFITDAGHKLVLGPFSHFAAVTDFVTGILIRLDADSEDGVYGIELVADADLPASPDVPLARSFAMEAMSPVMAADLTWEAQELLDAGGDVEAGISALEKGYLGARFDLMSADDYAAQGHAEVLAAVSAPQTVSSPDLETETPPPTEEARPEFPDVIRPIPVDGPMQSVEPQPAQNRFTRVPFPNMPRAATPRAHPFVPIDWRELPVRVVEEQLSDRLSLLLSRWTVERRTV